MNEQISRQLREAAEAHRPDRARMLARVERGMANATVTSRRPARTWSRVTLAGVAATGILATAGLAVAVVGSAPPPPDTMPPAVSNSSPAPSTTSQTPVAPPVTTNQPERSTPEVQDPPADRLSDGPLSSKGTVDPNSHQFWTQDTLVVTTTKPLTTFTVEVHVAQTGGVQDSGHWQTAPADDFTFTVQEADGELVYRWDLKPGRTLPAAKQIFGVQYNHTRGARDGKNDRYGVMSGSHAVFGGFGRG
jgi:hypothetical protein